MADVAARLDSWRGRAVGPDARPSSTCGSGRSTTASSPADRTFFMFEGLGSIYWHMVAKLLLAVQETYEAVDPAAEPELAAALAAAYDEIRDGLGFSEEVPGIRRLPKTEPVFPHATPSKGTATGMTGLVKEEILTRWGELGVRAEGGRVQLRPAAAPSRRVRGRAVRIPVRRPRRAGRRRGPLPAGSLAFTWCGTPISYRLARGEAAIHLETADGSRLESDGNELSAELSRELFERWRIRRIEVDVPEDWLRG